MYPTIAYVSPDERFSLQLINTFVGNRAFGLWSPTLPVNVPAEVDLKGLILDARDTAFRDQLSADLLPALPVLTLTTLDDQTERIEDFIGRLDLSGFDPTWCHRPPDSEASLPLPVSA